MDAVRWGPCDVLVVDDEAAICSIICEGLNDRGIRSMACTEPIRAKHLLSTQAFGVVIADVFMPGISGMELLAYIGEAAPNCKVILITGFPSRECLVEALKFGAYEYFQKPLDLRKLADAVTRALGEKTPRCGLPVRAARAMELEDQMTQVALESIRALTRAVEAKDPHTFRHSEQVAHYAVHLAGYLGLGEEKIESIRIASLVHDIGKIGIPDAVLTKPGRLTEEEFELIRPHPALGAEILRHISLFAPEAKLVRHHHENWDGSGYPDGLAGEEIPYGARVINIADSIDAMLMRRTYKEAYSVRRMIRELCRCAGAQFAPDIAAAAVDWCKSNHNKLIRSSAAA